ncbi:MAG TPA: multicopper oxidase domain-containing protein [Gemmatimonadales bacterium]|nr:multicopper oxidase domain-containing protein [Gemmatimonadales bacterium]
MGRRQAGVVLCLLASLAGSTVVSAQAKPRIRPRRTTTYYVAADTVTWDFTPSGSNQITGQPWDSVERPFVEAGKWHIGHVALKAMYREYTDSTFATLKPRPPESQYLGILGPLLRAEVGDTIRVVFRNNLDAPTTMHPHGVFYTKASEGAPYVGGPGERDLEGNAVPPGHTHVYIWPVPARAGPASGDGNSILWMYHSHIHEEEDLSTGLLGPIIVSARGATRADGTPKDVDREVVLAFDEIDEDASRYLKTNLHRYATQGDSAPIVFAFGVASAGGPAESQDNFKETLNGYMYGNGPMPTMKVGERVRWYLLASTGFEIHSPHWHGNTVQVAHMRTDVAMLLPMGMVVADMVPDNPGIWLVHCHVSSHLRMGMQGRYVVTR